MATVTCKLAHASEKINGVDFVRQDDGSVVAECDEQVAAQFDGIPGYAVDYAEKKPARGRRAAAAPATAAPATDGDLLAGGDGAAQSTDSAPFPGADAPKE